MNQPAQRISIVYRCPKCESQDLRAEATITVTIVNDPMGMRTECENLDPYLTDTSHTECQNEECEYGGNLDEFEIVEVIED